MNNHESNDHELSTKRKNTATKRRHDNIVNNNNNDQEAADDKDFLTLSLTWGPTKQPKRTAPNTQHQHQHQHQHQNQHQHQLPPLLLPPHQDFQNPSPQQTVNASHPFFTSSPPITPISQYPILDPYNNVAAAPTTATTVNVGPSRGPRPRRNPTQIPRDHGKSENIPTPFPWATNHRATVHSLDYLLARKIDVITGLVQCKRCEKQYELGFNLREKFLEVGTFIAENKNSMCDRAPSVWMTPVLPTCKYCDQENSLKPVISDKKKGINWLFLLLGQMLGCCTLEQLKYFCKHTKNHRTGAKDRVLYLTYLGLCKQLDSSGPFDR